MEWIFAFVITIESVCIYIYKARICIRSNLSCRVLVLLFADDRGGGEG
jgi:hypothetical protein